MNLLERRRAMMSRKAELEHWDYIWTAQADGTIHQINLAADPTTKDWWVLQPQQTVTVAWDMTGFDGDQTRIFVLCNTTNLFNRTIYEHELTETKGEMTFQWNGTSVGKPTFLISRAWANTTGPRFKGRYIKIRINPLG